MCQVCKSEEFFHQFSVELKLKRFLRNNERKYLPVCCYFIFRERGTIVSFLFWYFEVRNIGKLEGSVDNGGMVSGGYFFYSMRTFSESWEIEIEIEKSCRKSSTSRACGTESLAQTLLPEILQVSPFVFWRAIRFPPHPLLSAFASGDSF